MTLFDLFVRLDRDINALSRATDASQRAIDGATEAMERLGKEIRDRVRERRVKPYQPSQPATPDSCNTQEEGLP